MLSVVVFVIVVVVVVEVSFRSVLYLLSDNRGFRRAAIIRLSSRVADMAYPERRSMPLIRTSSITHFPDPDSCVKWPYDNCLLYG